MAAHNCQVPLTDLAHSPHPTRFRAETDYGNLFLCQLNTDHTLNLHLGELNVRLTLFK